jgi:hypothetical protein
MPRVRAYGNQDLSYFTTEVLYAGGAVQQYIDTAPISFKGWDGSDAAPPTYPFCPEPNPIPETQTPPAPTPEKPDPPCVDVAGECLPIGYREDAGCGYKYIDVITGNIYEMTEDFVTDEVEASGQKSYVKSWRLTKKLQIPGTGDLTRYAQNAVVRSEIVTVALNSRTDTYGGHAGDTNEIKQLQDDWHFNNRSAYPDVNSPRDVYGEFIPYDPNPNSSTKAGWTIEWGEPRSSWRTYQIMFKTNAIQLSGSALAGIEAVKGSICSFKQWDMYGQCMQEGENPFSGSKGGALCGDSPGDHGPNSCLGKDYWYRVGNNGRTAYWVGIVWDSVPLSSFWMNNGPYPTRQSYWNGWTVQARENYYSWAVARLDPTDSWYANAAGAEYHGVNQKKWTCPAQCGNYGGGITPACPDDQIWTSDTPYAYNMNYYATNDWDRSYDPAEGFSGWVYENRNLSDLAHDFITDPTPGAPTWGGGGQSFVTINYLALACQRKLSGSVSTRDLPSLESFNGTVTYTTDNNGNAYSWVWQDNDWYEFGQAPVYNGGEI